MTTWKRSVKAIEGGKDEPMKRLGQNAVSAHHKPLYCLFEVRWDGGDSRLAWQHSASGLDGGWTSHMRDLLTGEAFDVPCDDPSIEARWVPTTSLPAAVVALWPKEKGKLVPQGFREEGEQAGPAFFAEVVEKVRPPEECEKCGGSGVIDVPMPAIGGVQMKDARVVCPGCANLRRWQGKEVRT